MDTLADRLAARTLELVDIPSKSLHEAEIREHVRGAVPAPFDEVFAGDEAFLWTRPRRHGVPLLVLAGHYDTVPAQGNLPGRIEDGWVVGCGASDMKGGVAVAVELVRELAGSDPGPADVALLLFGREELPPIFNPLPALFDGCPIVHEAGLAVLLEPTDLEIQAGCVGNVTARVMFNGRSGHSALPGWSWAKGSARYPSRQDMLEYLGQYAARFRLEPRFGQRVCLAERRDGAWLIRTQDAAYEAPNLVVASGLNREPKPKSLQSGPPREHVGARLLLDQPLGQCRGLHAGAGVDAEHVR